MPTAEFEALKAKLWKFMREDIYPNELLNMEQARAIGRSGNEWTHTPIMIELKRKAPTCHTFLGTPPATHTRTCSGEAARWSHDSARAQSSCTFAGGRSLI